MATGKVKAPAASDSKEALRARIASALVDKKPFKAPAKEERSVPKGIKSFDTKIAPTGAAPSFPSDGISVDVISGGEAADQLLSIADAVRVASTEKDLKVSRVASALATLRGAGDSVNYLKLVEKTRETAKSLFEANRVKEGSVFSQVLRIASTDFPMNDQTIQTELLAVAARTAGENFDAKEVKAKVTAGANPVDDTSDPTTTFPTDSTLQSVARTAAEFDSDDVPAKVTAGAGVSKDTQDISTDFPENSPLQKVARTAAVSRRAAYAQQIESAVKRGNFTRVANLTSELKQLELGDPEKGLVDAHHDAMVVKIDVQTPTLSTDTGDLEVRVAAEETEETEETEGSNTFSADVLAAVAEHKFVLVVKEDTTCFAAKETPEGIVYATQHSLEEGGKPIEAAVVDGIFEGMGGDDAELQFLTGQAARDKAVDFVGGAEFAEESASEESASEESTSEGEAPREASVKVRQPVHVPLELSELWFSIARRMASRGELLKGKDINYKALNQRYIATLREAAARIESNSEMVSRIASDGTSSAATLYPPKDMPKVFQKLWSGTIRGVATTPRIRLASGQINHNFIRSEFVSVLKGLADFAVL